VYTLTVASVDINGIVYFIDDKTIYNTEDIINEDDNPKIIGRLNRKTVYKIASLRTAYRSALTLADLMHDKLLRGLLLSIMYFLTRPPVRRPPCSICLTNS
jgi:hypothetical protein